MIIIRRSYLTLIEIMVVIFLIMLITGTLAYNFKGALDEGKATNTEIGMRKIEDQLELAIAKNPDLLDEVESNWKSILASSPLTQNVSQMSKDGWGREYEVRVVDGKIEVTSTKYEEYRRKHARSARH